MRFSRRNYEERNAQASKCPGQTPRLIFISQLFFPMYFKKLTMTNFLGVDTRTVEFGKMTNIFGRNGSGKTSIREAIIFALTGAIYGTPQIDTAVRK